MNSMIADDLLDQDQTTYWEDVAKSRWGNYITEVEKRVIFKAHDLLRKPGVALEVGCEGGRWSKLLSDLGWNMICTDVNPNTLAMCQKRIPMAKCILVEMENTRLPCESGSVKFLLCIEVFDVILNKSFIKEAFRVLQNGGIVAGVFNNKLSLRGYVRHLSSVAQGKFDSYKVSYPSWRRKLCQQGFKMIYEEGLCWFPFTRTSNSPLIPPLTQVEYRLGLYRLPSVSPWIVFLAQKM
jgi:ubiquinone/menaquinone biosynthesis C-methylase UbiE